MLDRFSTDIPSLTVGATAAATTEIPFGSYSMGVVFVPAGSSITSLTWNAAPKMGGTYLPISDEDGVAITQTVAAGKAYQIPVALAGAIALKPVGDAGGTVDVSLKG